jgi:hypothetical protein
MILDHDKGSLRWWCSEPETVHQDILTACRRVRDDDSGRLAANTHHASLYRSEGCTSPNDYDPEKVVSLNVVKSAIDAVVAKIGKQRPAPKPLTDGGSPSLRRKAKLLERFLLAQFDISGVYQEMPRAALDAGVFGTGAVKVFLQDGQIVVERVYPSELFVDKADGLYAKPRSLLQKKWVSRDELREMFPKHEAEILAARGSNGEGQDAHDLYFDSSADQVLVVEGWYLPGKGKKGRRVLAIETVTLVDEAWGNPWFPFVFMRWNEPLRGFWGTGIAEELNGIQVEINRLLRKIQAAFHLAAVPRVFVDAASKLQKTQFDNRIGAIVPYVGKPPTVSVPQTIHPEMFAHLDRLYTRAFEIVGVSQLAARMQNPLGGDASGIALQTWHDLETERFAIQAAKYETAILELSKIFIALAKELGGNFAAPSARDRYTVDRIKWAEVDMEEDEYILRVFPVSSLPSTPAGKLRAVTSMMAAGLVPPDEARRLLQFPDFEAEDSLEQASQDVLDKIFEQILDEGERISPEPYMDLNLALKRGQAWLLRAQVQDVPEDRLELLRSFLMKVRRMQQVAQVEQMKLAAEAAGQNQPMNPASPPAAGPAGAPPTAVQSTDGAM